MQLGFVLDQSRCIGCHACTVACKSENHVPVGSFRTWVKYTESGVFPEVRRSFAVLRCNQCTNAPCVTICPTNALEKRADGIVDLDQSACIGCKSCMQGCPYDALYINPDKGTAEKCHFCAHRTERGLAPACAVVCPTEAIIPGDFDDPESVVSRMKREFELDARKPEAGTGPNVLYRDAAPAGIVPSQTSLSGGLLWSDRHPSQEVDPEEAKVLEEKAKGRTVYDVPHAPLWGWKITGYLFAKSLAAGAFLAAIGLPGTVLGGGTQTAIGIPALGLFFLAVTSLLLVLDLKKPSRFYYILTRPNWNSWLVRGTFAIMAYGLLLSVWLLLGLLETEVSNGVRLGLGIPTGLAGALTAAYTGWLFGQAKGRVLWMRRGLWLQLLVQALVAGCAALLVTGPILGLADANADYIRWGLAGALGLHLVFLLTEGSLAPARRQEEYARAMVSIQKGRFAKLHRIGVVFLGTLAPLALALVPGIPALALVAGLLALIGLWIEEDVYVRAGQLLPIS